MASSNEKLLNAIDLIFDSSPSEKTITYSQEQLEMLKMGEEDIKYVRVISEEDLKKSDEEWLK